ncbi:hypothetical protein CLOP_g4865 [Closterium sp. NIES-67]|nr:hypothetical protein CLOP_g4865 [Closterium sp. NIES-67]
MRGRNGRLNGTDGRTDGRTKLFPRWNHIGTRAELPRTRNAQVSVCVVTLTTPGSQPRVADAERSSESDESRSDRGPNRSARIDVELREILISESRVVSG